MICAKPVALRGTRGRDELVIVCSQSIHPENPGANQRSYSKNVLGWFLLRKKNNKRIWSIRGFLR